MTPTVAVWAWRPLVELDGRTGFVECDVELARALLEAGAVQAGQHGHPTMLPIQGGEPVTGLPNPDVGLPIDPGQPDGPAGRRATKPRGTITK